MYLITSLFQYVFFDLLSGLISAHFQCINKGSPEPPCFHFCPPPWKGSTTPPEESTAANNNPCTLLHAPECSCHNGWDNCTKLLILHFHFSFMVPPCILATLIHESCHLALLFPLLCSCKPWQRCTQSKGRHLPAKKVGKHWIGVVAVLGQTVTV